MLQSLEVGEARVEGSGDECDAWRFSLPFRSKKGRVTRLQVAP